MVTLPWPKNPLIYEINTWTYLHQLTEKYGHPVTLDTIPSHEIDALAAWGFDAIWLMGVWERSPDGRKIALEHPGLQAEYQHALPDFTENDIIGSPYAIHQYVVEPHFGGPAALAKFREQLRARGLRLILDFVPNHVATDHPWLADCGDCFVQGTPADIDNHPESFFQGPKPKQVYANGRDPYFPAWTDTAQLNAFSAAYRSKAVAALNAIAGQCDGVRCDMAMLLTNRIFAQTWGDRGGAMPPTEFWEVVIPAIKQQQPGFLFMAEVYWDMEYELQQQGFDYTYDKRLYDRTLDGNARTIGLHLIADPAYQAHMVRFTENHDEKRTTMAHGPGRDLASAVLVATLPGAALFHDGQMMGHMVKLPVQLGRRPAEPDNQEIATFYRMLLGEACHPVYKTGTWQGREMHSAWDLNASHRSLIAYSWRAGEERRLIVINFSNHSSQGRVPLPDFDLRGRAWNLFDALHLTEYDRDGNEIADAGIYIDLLPWQSHIFRFKAC